MSSLIATKPQDTEAQNLSVRAAQMQAMAGALVIDSDERYQAATDMAGQVARMKKALEERRTALVKPLNDHVKGINEWIKGLAAPLNITDEAIRSKMLTYQQEKQRIARVEQARLQALADQERARLQAIADKERAKLEAKAERKGIELPPAPPPVAAAQVYIAPIVKTVAGSAASATMKTVWKFEVVDKAQVPESFKAVNEAAVGAAVRAGVRDIPGVRIYEEQELSVRSR